MGDGFGCFKLRLLSVNCQTATRQGEDNTLAFNLGVDILFSRHGDDTWWCISGVSLMGFQIFS